MPDPPGAAPAEWAPVPGLAGGAVRSFLRRPDVCCSNAFLLSLPGAVLAVDAGADPAQADLIAEEIRRLASDGPRPALLVLTHCHVDHAAAAPRLRAAGAEVCAHALGAGPLEAGDAERTAAFLLGGPGVAVGVDRRLLGASRHELVRAGGVVVAEIYHAPGHSPDGLVIRAGDLLFVGDLLFALDPVVAAVPGFDPAALAGTVGLLRGLLDGGTVATVLPGHGAPLTAAQASRILARMEAQLAAGTSVVPMTPARVVATRVVAQELLEEADRVFSLLGGRMLALAHHLAALGEEEASAQVEAAFDSDVDACLSGFARFAEAHAAGERVDVQLVLKAVQATGKIAATLGSGRFGDDADAALVGRFRRLAEDFLALVETGAPAVAPARVDLAAAAAGAASRAVTPPVPDDEVLAAAGDEAAFRAVLVRRLAAPPLFAPGAVRLAAPPGEAAVLTDPARLGDVLAALLEDLAGAGHATASIGVEAGDGTVLLEVAGDPAGPSPVGPRRREAYRRRLEALGAAAVLEDAPFRCRAAFPRVS